MKQFEIVGAVGALSLMASSVAMAAGVDQFVGPAIYASMDRSSSSLGISDTDSSIELGGTSDIGFVVGADYGFALSESMTLTVGADYSLSDYDVASLSVNDGQNVSTEEVKLEDQYSFYLAPGFAVSDSTLIYAKVSYNDASVTISGVDTLSGGSAGSGPYSVGSDLSGWGYGFGIRTYPSKNLFVGVEISQIDWDDEVLEDMDGTFSVDSETTRASLQLGYKF